MRAWMEACPDEAMDAFRGHAAAAASIQRRQRSVLAKYRIFAAGDPELNDEMRDYIVLDFANARPEHFGDTLPGQFWRRGEPPLSPESNADGATTPCQKMFLPRSVLQFLHLSVLQHCGWGEGKRGAAHC